MSLLSSGHSLAAIVILVLLLFIPLGWPALVMPGDEVQGRVVVRNPALALTHTPLAHRLGLGQSLNLHEFQLLLCEMGLMTVPSTSQDCLDTV